jgi:Tol biopolymer transport system component
MRILIVAAIVAFATSQQNIEPELFAPGIISTADDELNAAFTPDQRTVYFTKSTPSNRMGVIFVSQLRGNKWSSPEVASFSGRYADYDPFVTVDGAHIYFISNRPKPDSATTKPQRTFDIWVVDKIADGWSAPMSFGAPINTEGQEFYPTLSANGTMYFSSTRPGGKGAGDIYRSRFVDGHFTEPESLGDSINTASHEGDPYIAPDESYIVFASYGRPDDLGRGGSNSAGDLYISENVGGVWSKARHLDAPISSTAWDYCPIVSPDGKYFYFSSYRGFADSLPLAPQSARSLSEQLHGIRNGLGNVYRVDIATLRRSAHAGR